MHKRNFALKQDAYGKHTRIKNLEATMHQLETLKDQYDEEKRILLKKTREVTY